MEIGGWKGKWKCVVKIRGRGMERKEEVGGEEVGVSRGGQEAVTTATIMKHENKLPDRGQDKKCIAWWGGGSGRREGGEEEGKGDRKRSIYSFKPAITENKVKKRRRKKKTKSKISFVTRLKIRFIIPKPNHKKGANKTRNYKLLLFYILF